MEVNDLIVTVFKLVDILNFEWNVHFVFIVAFLGWLLSMKRNPTIPVKVLVSSGLVLFAISNAWTLHEYYHVLTVVITELKATAHVSTFHAPETYMLIKGLTTKNYEYIIWFVQVPIDILLIIGLWFDKLWKRDQ